MSVHNTHAAYFGPLTHLNVPHAHREIARYIEQFYHIVRIHPYGRFANRPYNFLSGAIHATPTQSPHCPNKNMPIDTMPRIVLHSLFYGD